MAALFSRRSNSMLALCLSLLAGAAVCAPTALILAPHTPYVTGEGRPIEQPIAFDHRHHVADDGIDCRYCHDSVEVSSRAGVPSAERCLNCHSQVWNASPQLAPVWQSYRSGLPIPWVRVHQLPDFVYFNHSAHVNHGVGCITCHGRVDRMPRIVQAVPLTMQWCVDCHRDPAPRQRPRELVTAMIPDPVGATPPRDVAASAFAALPGTDCTTCHR